MGYTKNTHRVPREPRPGVCHLPTGSAREHCAHDCWALLRFSQDPAPSQSWTGARPEPEPAPSQGVWRSLRFWHHRCLADLGTPFTLRDKTSTKKEISWPSSLRSLGADLIASGAVRSRCSEDVWNLPLHSGAHVPRLTSCSVMVILRGTEVGTCS